MASLAPSYSLPAAAEVLLEAEALSGSQAELYARLRQVEERYSQAYTEAQGGCSLRSPSTGGTSTTWYLGAMQDDIDHIRKQLGLKPIYSLSAVAEEDDDAVCVPVPSPIVHSMTSYVLPPPLVRVNAFTSAAAVGAGGGGGLDMSAFAAPVDTFRAATDSAASAGGGIASVLAMEHDPAVDAIMVQLRTLRATLQVRQDSLYEEQARSHDEMATADQEWDDLDNKIHAIEGVLSSFRKIFRQR